MPQAYLEKGNLSAPIRSRPKTFRLTSSDALSLSYRRRMGAKGIKLGSREKHPAYCLDWNVNVWHTCMCNGINEDLGRFCFCFLVMIFRCAYCISMFHVVFSKCFVIGVLGRKN